MADGSWFAVYGWYLDLRDARVGLQELLEECCLALRRILPREGNRSADHTEA